MQMETRLTQLNNGEPPTCLGQTLDHCCYTPVGENGVCPYLEIATVPGRYWVCGMRRELGSWEAVYADPAYQEIWGETFRCGDFGPASRQCCYAESG